MHTLHRYWHVLAALLGTAVSVLVLFVIVPRGEAQGTPTNVLQWRPVGPSGGEVTSLIPSPADPNTVFAITRGASGNSTDSLYKSTDRGSTWTIINHANVTSGTAFIALSALAIDPSNPLTMYLAGHNGWPTVVNPTAVFKTTDGGATWSPLSGGLSGLTSFIASLAIDPLNPNTIYAGGTGLGGSNLTRSIDGGKTWATYSPLPQFGTPTSISFDPVNKAVAYIQFVPAGTSRSGSPYLLRSSDSGQTWQPIAANGLPLATSLSALAMNGAQPQTTYAGFAGEVGGVYKTTNGGALWTPASAGLPGGPNGGVVALAVDPTTANTAYLAAANTLSNTPGGVYKTTDGLTWAPSNSGLPNTLVNVLAVNPTTPTLVYAGLKNKSVYRSSNSGAAWSAGTGLPANCDATQIAASVAQPSRVLAAIECSSSSAVYLSVDGGAAWSATFLQFSGLVRFGGLVAHPVSPTVAYAGIHDGQIYWTTDGQFWNYLSTITRTISTSPLLTGTTSIDGLAIDRTNPNILYAVSNQVNGHFFRSTDGGRTWTEMTSNLPTADINAFAVDPSASGRVLAGLAPGSLSGSASVVYQTANGGGSWSAAATGLPGGGIGRFTALAMDPATSGTLYAGFTSFSDPAPLVPALYKSTDAGATWSAIGAGLPLTLTLRLRVDPTNPANILALSPNGLFVSSDSGANFSPLAPSGVPSDSIPSDIQVLTGTNQPTQPGPTATYLLAVTTDFAKQNNPLRTPIFRADSPTGSWLPSGAGIRALTTRDIVIDPRNPEILYAAARYGILKSSDAGGTWTFLPTPPQFGGGFGLTSYFQPEKLLISPDGTTLHAIDAANTANFIRSTDGGRTWLTSTLGADVFEADQQTFVMAPSVSTTLYVGGGQFGNYVFRSTDGAVSWQQRMSITTASGFEVLAVDPRDANTLLAGTLGVPTATNILWKSIDGAGSWTPIGAGLPPTSTYLFGPGVQGNGVFGLAIVPAKPDVVLAVVRGFAGSQISWTLYRSSDGGATFAAVTGISSTLLSGEPRFTFDPSSPDTVYISSSSRFNAGGRVAVSTDAGQTWTEVKNGLNGLPVNGLAVARYGSDPFSTVFAATGGGSVYKLGYERNLIPLVGRNGALEPR